MEGCTNPWAAAVTITGACRVQAGPQPGLGRVLRLGTVGWEAKEKDRSKSRQSHLHCVGLSCPRLPIGEDADVVAVDAGGDQGLNLLKHLGRIKECQKKVAVCPLHTSSVDSSTHLLLGCLWGEDLIQLKGHLLSLVQEVQDSIIIGVKGHCIGCLWSFTVLLRDGADSPKNTDVSLEEGTQGSRWSWHILLPLLRSLSNTGWAEHCTPSYGDVEHPSHPRCWGAGG